MHPMAALVYWLIGLLTGIMIGATIMALIHPCAG